MIKLYKKIEQFWFTWPNKLRFLLVGGFNTAASYFLFVGLNLVLNYGWALVLTYAIAINLSIFTMRYYVFRGSGNLAKQYSKALLTYLLAIICNYVFLFFSVDIIEQPLWLAQAEFTIISTIAIYILHKRINFK